MLNRTNRTLSANTNRLNLGTRTLAANAGTNLGNTTLRFAHAYHQFVDVRADVADFTGFVKTEGARIMPLEPTKPAMPAMSGPSPEPSRLQPRSRAARDQRQGPSISLASALARPAVVRLDDATARRGDGLRASLRPIRPLRSSLGWRCGRSEFPAQIAQVTLVPVAAP